MAPSYFIGLGGTGAEVIVELQSRLKNTNGDSVANKDFAFSIIDIDESSLRRATDSSTQGCVTFDDILHLPLRQASEIRDRNQNDFSPLSRRWLYNIPRSGMTEGVRPMAMLATLDNVESIYHHLRCKLEKLIETHSAGNAQKPMRLYLVGSCHGATGSVLSIELAFLIRQMLTELNVQGEILSIMTAAKEPIVILSNSKLQPGLHVFERFSTTFKRMAYIQGSRNLVLAISPILLGETSISFTVVILVAHLDGEWPFTKSSNFCWLIRLRR